MWNRRSGTCPVSALGLANVRIQLVVGSVTRMSENAQMKLTTEDFYVQPGCCTSCGVPQSVAPDLVGWTNENHPQCYWIKQPENAAELNQAIKLFQTQELGCHRYSGNDPAVLQNCPPKTATIFVLTLGCILFRILHFRAPRRGSRCPRRWNAVRSEDFGESCFLNNVGQPRSVGLPGSGTADRHLSGFGVFQDLA